MATQDSKMKGKYQHLDNDEENPYGDDNQAFFMAQNRDGKGPIHVGVGVQIPIERDTYERKNPCQCWLVAFRKETWINWVYNVFLNMIFGSFCWPFFTSLIILGGTLLPFCVGVPILLGTLQLARFLAVADINLLNLTVPKSKRVYRVLDDTLHPEQTFRGWASIICCSCQSYADLFFLWLCKMPIAWFGFFTTVCLSGISVAMISAPVVFWSCDICFKKGNMCLGDAQGDWSTGTCNGWKIDTIGDTFGLFFIGIVLIVVTLHISNGLAWLSRELSRCALASESNVTAARSHLLANQQDQKYGNPTSAPIGSFTDSEQEKLIASNNEK